MRRWFRKKDRKPDDLEPEAESPSEVEPQETAAVTEEVPPAPEPQLTARATAPLPGPPPLEALSGEGKSEPLPLETAAPEEPILDLEEEYREEVRRRRFSRFRERLTRTRKSLAGGLERLFLGRRELDAELLEELEEILITADLGVDTALRLVEVIRDKVKRRELHDADRLK